MSGRCRLLGVSLLMVVAAAARGEVGSGVTVTEVRPGSSLAAAGLQVGDVVTRWRARAVEAAARSSEGALTGPFDWLRVRVEQAPLGDVDLDGQRGGAATAWHLPPGPWDGSLDPLLPPALAGRERTARALASSGKAEEAAGGWEALAREVTASPLAAGWLDLQAALAWTDCRKFPEGAAALDRALARVVSDAFARTVVLHAQARAAERANDLARAEALYGEAATLREQAFGDGLALAESLNLQGLVVRKRGQLDRAHDLFARAWSIHERLAPASLEAALSLNNLGVVAFFKGDLPTAEQLYRRALALRERLAPGSLDLAASLNNLGNVCLDQGQLGEAEAFYRRSLAIREKVSPDSMDVAFSLNNLGNVAFNRGDLLAAETSYARSLAIKERLQPGSPDVAMTLRNVGMVQSVRGDLDAAGKMFARALDIYSRLAPGSVQEAMCLYDLGTLAVNRGELARAQELLGKTLAIQEKLAPDSYDVAATELNLGEACELSGDRGAARTHYERALAIREKLAPGGLDVSFALLALASLARESSDLENAETLARKSLQIREKLVPESWDTARALHELGRIARARGRMQDASDLFGRAVAALEAQLRNLGGSREQQASFRARFMELYRDRVDALHELGRDEEALGVLESSRARLLLALLAERDLSLDREAGAALEAERAALAREYDRLEGQLEGLAPERDAVEVEKVSGELTQVRERQASLRERMRAVAPRAASVRDPQPLSGAGVRASLPAGTLLLAFSTGRERTVAFWATHEALGSVSIPVGSDSLGKQVHTWRDLVQHGAVGRSGEALDEAGARLYDELLRPLEARLAGAKRVVVVPDGPLHLLPLGALVRAQGPAGKRPSYLAEWKPLSVTVSATLLEELGRRKPVSGPGELVALGDPVVAEPAGRGESAPVTRGEALQARSSILEGLRRQGVELGPLPATRREVAALGRLWGDHAVVLVGDAATEGRVLRLGRGTSYVHFACHGLVDERFPLDSSLILSPPAAGADQDGNGILQAWEVFELVRLDAELVALSACETALGKELEGEGIIGLVRAFQYAGARTVVASLWSVADDTTAALMTKLYQGLHDGLPKDRALQAAQEELLRHPVRVTDATGKELEIDAASPFFWAAFQLYGDGR